MPDRTRYGVSHGAQVGVLLGIADYFVFQHTLPGTVSEIRLAEPFDQFVEGSEREALYLCIGLNGLVALFMRNWDTFVVSSAMLVVLDFAYKHANAVSPASNTMQAPNSTGQLSGNEQAYSLPSYTADGSMSPTGQ
jgi:hypothetical protein